MESHLPVFWVFVLNVLFLLLTTLAIAGLTLLERKILSLIQMRDGPNFVGFKGRLQYIADALKLLAKGAVIPKGVSRFWFVACPSLVIGVAYSFLANVT